ncbi:MAG: rRNA maturation RNase YbeY [Puniceicoccales bacterium]|jgi:probable rRNA maturation factor|nr:rRNA maturation RNase YbeY [Puniceicoccales bacterium]
MRKDANFRVVDVYSGCRAFAFEEDSVRRVVEVIDAKMSFSMPKGNLSVAFLPLRKLRVLHWKYLADDSLTDVMTFPGDAKMSFAGEIIVAPAFALRQLALHQTTFSEEVTLYLVHGYLHLCGLNDKTADECQKMRSAEQECLQLLQKHGAMVECQWKRSGKEIMV